MHLTIELKNNVTINKSIYQSLNILQLSSLNLDEMLKDEIEKNPFLEKYEENDHHINTSSLSSHFSNISDRYCSKQTQDYIEQYTTFESLEQMLERQIHYIFKNPQDRMIARELISYLSEEGYLQINHMNFSKKYKITLLHLRKIISNLQDCDPCGIFAENYIECFKIQLHKNGKYDKHSKIILNNLEVIAKEGIVKAAKILHISHITLQKHLHFISQLNLKPAMAIDQTIQYIKPDASLFYDQNDNIVIDIAKSIANLNKDYYKQVQCAVRSGEDQKKIKHFYQNASTLIKAVEQRHSSLYKLLKFIADNQKDFFKQGSNHLKPMSFKEVAQSLEMHESTISRIVCNKHINTACGMLPLKFFFTNAIPQTRMGQQISISSRVIKNLIKNLVLNEKENDILSDDKICEILSSKNFNIARRTITKYRKGLGIASSQMRKKMQNNIKEIKYGY